MILPQLYCHAALVEKAAWMAALLQLLREEAPENIYLMSVTAATFQWLEA